MKGLDLLQEKLEKHRECLKDVDESIKKLTGRNEATPAASKYVNDLNGEFILFKYFYF
jgi:hypothetical protein